MRIEEVVAVGSDVTGASMGRSRVLRFAESVHTAFGNRSDWMCDESGTIRVVEDMPWAIRIGATVSGFVLPLSTLVAMAWFIPRPFSHFMWVIVGVVGVPIFVGGGVGRMLLRREVEIALPTKQVSEMVFLGRRLVARRSFEATRMLSFYPGCVSSDGEQHLGCGWIWLCGEEPARVLVWKQQDELELARWVELRDLLRTTFDDAIPHPVDDPEN